MGGGGGGESDGDGLGRLLCLIHKHNRFYRIP